MAAPKKKVKAYYFVNVIFIKGSGWCPDYYELYSGKGITPEQALDSATDPYDLEDGKTNNVFYFTLEADSSKRESGLLNVTRTGLKIERA